MSEATNAWPRKVAEAQPLMQPHDYAFDARLALMRCVVAGESFRLNGRLPSWARDPT